MVENGMKGGIGLNEIFKLVGEYQEYYDMLTDPEMDEDSVMGMLQVIASEITDKAAGLAVIRDRLKMEKDACEEHEKEWYARKKVRENNLKRIDQMIIDVMGRLELTDLEAGDVTFHTQNAGGQLPLIIDENKTVPERFTKLTIENDKGLIRKALENGEKLDFARFGERSKVLKVK